MGVRSVLRLILTTSPKTLKNTGILERQGDFIRNSFNLNLSNTGADRAALTTT